VGGRCRSRARLNLHNFGLLRHRGCVRGNRPRLGNRLDGGHDLVVAIRFLFLLLPWLVHVQRLSVFGLAHALENFRRNVFGEKLLAKGTEKVRLHENVELDPVQKPILHAVQLEVRQHREQLRKGRVPDRLVLPHLVSNEQSRDEEWPPRARMQGNMRRFLESRKVYDRDDERAHGKDSLVQNRENERAYVKGGGVVDTCTENWVKQRLRLLVLNFIEQPEDAVPFHPSYHIGVRPNVPMEEVQTSTEKPLLDLREAL
jgi:hypothetical protein